MMNPAANSGGAHSSEYASYPHLSAEDVAPPPQPQVPPAGVGSNPYLFPSPAASGSSSQTSTGARESLRDAIGKLGKQLGEAAKKTEGLAGDVWQHLKTGPSVADAAMGRLSQTTKVLTEGGYEKIFQQTFDTVPDERFKKAYACYLSASSGPIMGVLYLSTAKLAFNSDNPVVYNAGNHTESRFYKVVIPLQQLRSVTPSASRQNPAEKYIQVVSVDNHEFWFMGFVNYDGAVKSLQEAVCAT